jgi:hypothetical protein
LEGGCYVEKRIKAIANIRKAAVGDLEFNFYPPFFELFLFQPSLLEHQNAQAENLPEGPVPGVYNPHSDR